MKIAKIKEYIKNLFKSKSYMLNQESDNLYALLRPRVLDTLALPIERVIKKYDPSKPSILLIDNSKYILSMLEDYLTLCGVTEEKYNILKFFDMYAPFVMIETLQKLEPLGLKKIEYAIIDIVLPGKFYKNNKVLRMDGIDVSIFLEETYDCKKFLFFSGNVVNSYVSYIEEKIKKFKEHFGLELKEYIVNKTESDDVIVKKFKNLFQDMN